MSAVLVDARKMAMKLSPEDRFALAHELFESLDAQDEPITTEEIDRRIAEMRAGIGQSLFISDLEKSMQEALDGLPSSHS